MQKSQYQKVHRGMVFWFDPDEVYPGKSAGYIRNNIDHKSHIQKGIRPWVVVSNDDGNSSAPTCNICPITTSETKNAIPVHVQYFANGKLQTILVEQVRTIDIMALDSYVHTLSDEIMNRVEKALAIQFAIRPSVTYMDLKLENIVQHLEKVVENLMQEKAKAIVQSIQSPDMVSDAQIEDAALNLGITLENLMKPVATVVQSISTPVAIHAESISEPLKVDSHLSSTTQISAPVSVVSSQPSTPTPKQQATQTAPAHGVSQSLKSLNVGNKGKYDGMSAVERFNARYHRESSDNKTKTAENPLKTANTASSKPQRNKWTIDSRKEYLKDCEELNPFEVMKKWGLGSPKSVMQTKYLHKSYLESLANKNKGE